MMPHRRNSEKYDLMYERTADSNANISKTDLHGNPITLGVPM